MREVITQGIVIPAWTDINIVKNGQNWDWSVGQSVHKHGWRYRVSQFFTD